jgi:hypothetical protein
MPETGHAPTARTELIRIVTADGEGVPPWDATMLLGADADVYYDVPFDFDPQISHRPRRRRKPPQKPMWEMLREGGPGARAHAGRQMLARRGGLASAAQQRELGFPNLHKAWLARDLFWRRWRHEHGLPADQAESDLQTRRREVDIWSRGVVG